MCCEIYFVLLQILLLNLAWKHCVTIIGISGVEMMFLEMLCQVSRGIVINLEIIIIISDNSCCAMHVRGTFRAKNAANVLLRNSCYWSQLPQLSYYKSENWFPSILTLPHMPANIFQHSVHNSPVSPGPENRGVNLVILLPRRFTTTLVKPPWTPIYRHPLGIQWRQPTFGHFIWISFGWS